MKKALSLVLSLLLTLSFLTGCGGKAPSGGSTPPDNAASLPSLSGSGTADDPFLIGTADELCAFADKVTEDGLDGEFRCGCWRLTADIDLGGREWTPVGGELPFYGEFDGGGHSVSGFQITKKDLKNYGLFGELGENSLVKALTVANASISVKSSKSPYVGAIVGLSFGRFENCTVKSTVSFGGKDAYMLGGLAGSVSYRGGEPFGVVGCVNEASIVSESSASVGGIAGGIDGGALECVNTASLTAAGNVGGIAESISGNIRNCTNSGDILSTAHSAGGITVSWSDGALNTAENDSGIVLEGCVNTGAVDAHGHYAGGICAKASTGSIRGCENRGSVSGTQEVGGILGCFGLSPFGTPCECFTLSGCRNFGEIVSSEGSASYNVGGIVGQVYAESCDIVIDSCTNDGAVRSEKFSGGIVGGSTVYDGTFMLTDSRNSGEIVSAKGSGGMIGEYSITKDAEESGVSLTVQGCVNEGTVSSEQFSGGMLARCGSSSDSAKDCVFEGCINTGTLRTTEKEAALGGMVSAMLGTVRFTFQGCEHTGQFDAQNAVIAHTDSELAYTVA